MIFFSKLIKSLVDGYKFNYHIAEAKRCGKYLITITYQKDKDKLEHFWILNQFPTRMILPSLSFIYEEIDKKEIVFHDLLHKEDQQEGL